MIKLNRLAILIASGLLAVNSASAEIRVAVVGPLTGAYAAFGQQLKIGVEQAIAEVNGSGGVLGEAVVFSAADDRCEPKEAVAVANKIVNAGVEFVVGHFCSGSSIPASEVYNEEGILQISPASTNPQYTENGFELSFRNVGRDDQQGPTAANWILKNYRNANIAVVHDKQQYSAGLANAVSDVLKAAGVSIAVEDTINPGEQDYTTLISKLKNANVDLLYYGGYHTELGLIVRQAKDQGYSPKVLTGDALATQEFVQIAGDAAETVWFTFSPDARAIPSAKETVEKIREKYNFEPEGYTINSYVAVKIWADAVEATGTTDPYELADYMHSGVVFDTIIGDTSFDEKGDLTSASYSFYRWVGGEYEDIGPDPAP